MEWFFLAALSAIFAALVAIFAKIGLEGIDPSVGASVRAIIMMLFLVAVVMATGKGQLLTKFTTREMGFIVLSGVAGALSWLFYFGALRLADASKVAIIDRASVLVIIVLSVLFLGERLSAKTVAAGIFIFIGLLILSTSLD